MRVSLLVFFVLSAPCAADDAAERALIQRDQQSAEFARSEIENFNPEQLRQPLPAGARERVRRERDAFEFQITAPQPPASPNYAPSALPGGPARGIDPVAPNRRGS